MASNQVDLMFLYMRPLLDRKQSRMDQYLTYLPRACVVGIGIGFIITDAEGGVERKSNQRPQ